MTSEGARRLSLLLATLGVLGWIVFVFITSEGFSEMVGAKGWLVFIAGMPTCFFVPFGLVRAIAWVVEGFQRDKSKT